MDSASQGCRDVKLPTRGVKAKKVSWRGLTRELSRVGELGLHINNPNTDLESCRLTTTNSAQVVPNTMSVAQYVAARNGELVKLRSLLRGVADPDIKLLHVAAEEGHRDVVMYLAKQFPLKLNQKDELYQTALHLAVRKNQVAVVRWLMDQPHIERDCQDGYHRTPLHVAAGTGELQIIAELGKRPIKWENRDLDGRTPLHYAASEGHSRVVEELTKARGTSHPVVADPNVKDKLGCTPLHLAACNKEALRAFRMLLELPNISCDARNDDGLTPLHFAARAGNVEAVSQLQELYLDADNFISSVWLQTPLQLAAVAGHVQVVRVIRNHVEHDPNQLFKLALWSDAIGRTALHYAALYGRNDVVEELLDNWGSSMQSVLDRKDNGGFTALHLAAREGHEMVVQHLIAASADVNVKADSSSIPEYFHSLALREQDVQENLMGLDFVKSQGMSALHFAARGGHILVVEELFKSQQKLVSSAVDGAGLTPMDWAKVSGNLNLFLEHPVNEKIRCSPSELSSSQLKHLQDTWEMEKQEALTYQLQVHKNNVLFQPRPSFTRSGEDAKSVLHRAASRGDVKLLSQLLSLPQVNVNEQDIAGNTPTHLAARYGHVGALKVLLNHPATVPNIKNHCQDTPFRLAFQGNHVEACRMILGLPNCEEANLGRLLRLAIRNNLFEMCTMLVAQKGTRAMDLQGRTDGKTPLELAKEKGSRYVELLLRKKGVRRMLLEERQGFKETTDAILIAATLIASITYEGWLQPPLPQHPQLSPDDAALNSFWWLNSFSFYLAIAAVLAGAVGVLPTPRSQLTDSVVRARRAVTVAGTLLTSAILCVMGAFAAAGLAVIWDYRVAVLFPSVGGILLCMGILFWFARRLFRLHRMSTSWDFVSRDDHERPTTARLLDFTPLNSGPG